jgi:hypothetical protein
MLMHECRSRCLVVVVDGIMLAWHGHHVVHMKTRLVRERDRMMCVCYNLPDSVYSLRVSKSNRYEKTLDCAHQDSKLFPAYQSSPLCTQPSRGIKSTHRAYTIQHKHKTQHTGGNARNKDIWFSYFYHKYLRVPYKSVLARSIHKYKYGLAVKR